jgi:hypothetical protein
LIHQVLLSVHVPAISNTRVTVPLVQATG